MREEVVRSRDRRVASALTHDVIDILYIAGVLALIALIALLARGVERL